ncbi:MAG: RNA polymerase sigma factor [Bacteroidales bacterium]|nr:RNA polymerase sigma factor [Bacteroidales bacterium]
MTAAEYNCCVDEHADGVYRFVLKNIRSEDKARDIVQEVFARVWQKARDIEFSRSKSYIFTAAYHTMIDMIRKEQHEVLTAEIPEYSGFTTLGPEYSDIHEILDEALERLPAIQRSVLLLRDYEGYSYNEIGEITGLNESQVKVYIYRARMFLKNYLVSIDTLI